MPLPQHRRCYAIVPLLLGSGLLCLPVIGITGENDDAADSDRSRWASCAPPSGLFATPAPSADTQPGQTALSADEVVSQAGGASRFVGDVVIQRDGRTLQGDAASFDQRSGQVSVEGNVLFHGDGLVMQGERAQMRMQQQSGEFDGVAFHFTEQHAFGSADSLTLTDAEHSTLKGVRYTTCSPGHEDWLLSASELELDQQSNTGEAYNTVFRFKGVPIFYSPYLNFPLAGRKSGLLPPTLGSSQSDGTDVRLPLYWNIAPNYDATLTPRHLSKRGSMLMSEFRFLGEQSEGQIQADALWDDQLYGADRNYLAVDHRASFADGWSSELIARRASDPLYLSDLGADSIANSSSHLERRLDLNYRDQHWAFLARAQGYQTLSGTEPYQRLPQLKLSGRSSPQPNRLHYQLDSEAVSFTHSTPIPTGTRLDLKPTLSLPLQGSAWYLKPAAAWRYTHYQLKDAPQGEQFSRSLPILSLDSGLLFDRETEIAGNPITHTLEPRLFLLSVPYEDQSALPLFDTGSTNPDFNQLFRDNRFNGADRQGDSQQISAALTTRLLDQGNGSERLRASIGRSYYFDDRQVQLLGSDPVGTTAHSDIFAELALQPVERLHLGLNARYDTENERSRQLNGRLRYQPSAKRLLSLDYRYDEDAQLRQSDALAFWPMAREWQLLGRWRYDLANAKSLDLLAGVEYESCCWSVRLIGRNQRDALSDEPQRSIFLTFEFKGLGSLGGRLEDALEEGLLTYD